MSDLPARQPEATAADHAVILELIRGWKWFAHVPPEAHEWLAARGSLRQMPKGKNLYAAGDAATHIYAVASGVLRVFTASQQGDEITMEEVVRGGWFPHVLPVEQPTCLTHCVCQQDATVAAFPESALAELGRRWPSYYKGLYHELAARAVAIFGRIELLSLYNLNVRLAVYLLRMARLRGQKEAGGAVWVPAVDSQTEIGARVGGTRQRVNSVLKAWIKKGVIEMHKDGTRILDIERLRTEVERSGFDLAEYLAGWHGGWQGKP